MSQPTATRRVAYFHQSAGAVVMLEGRCLALRIVDRTEWVFPKGHLEMGESPESAAIREVREETGLEVALLGLIGSTRYSFGDDRQNRKRVDWFLARAVGGNLSLEPQFAAAGYFDAEAAQRTLTHDEDRDVAERAFEMISRLT